MEFWFYGNIQWIYNLDGSTLLRGNDNLKRFRKKIAKVELPLRRVKRTVTLL